MNIAPKPGRLATGAYLRYSPIDGDIFQVNNQTQVSTLPIGPGGISTKPSKMVLRSPISTHFDVSTIVKLDPSVHLNNMHSFHPSAKPGVQPQTRSILPMKKAVPVVHMTFGGSPNFPSDTAFHPINQPAPKPVFRSERSTERIASSLPGITSHNNLWYGVNQSFYNDQMQVGSGRVGQARWSTTKTGAV